MTDKQLYHLMVFIKACTDKICNAVALGDDFILLKNHDLPEQLLKTYKKKIWKQEKNP
jgi:hypothetical protein